MRPSGLVRRLHARSPSAVTKEVLLAVRDVAGAVAVRTNPQEVGWTVPLDEDEEHTTYDLAHVARYRAVAARRPEGVPCLPHPVATWTPSSR